MKSARTSLHAAIPSLGEFATIYSFSGKSNWRVNQLARQIVVSQNMELTLRRKPIHRTNKWLVVSTTLKNISQLG